MQINQITFCYSGTKIFLTTSDGCIRILSYPEFKPVLFAPSAPDERPREFLLNGHTSSCLTAELQPTARYLATGGSDSVIALWDTTDWLCQRTLTRMTGAVRSISMSYVLRPPNSYSLIIIWRYHHLSTTSMGGGRRRGLIREKN